MSFIERNKRWLLPLLGLAGAGVLGARLTGSDPPPTAQEAPLAEEAEAASPRPAPPSPGLNALPPGATHDTPFLQEGLRPLGASRRTPPPPSPLHPGSWNTLARLPEPSPTPHDAPPATRPKDHHLDFILESPRGREAWLDGRGYREGDLLPGGALLTHIGTHSVRITGPGGSREIRLSQRPPSQATP